MSEIFDDDFPDEPVGVRAVLDDDYDDDYNPDDPFGILKADRDAEIDARYETWPCNDCGAPILKGDELCGPCYEKERRAEETEGDTLANLGLCEADFR
jgi:hypothetical protein